MSTRSDRVVDERSVNRRWREEMRMMSAEHDREDRERAAALSPGERLAIGVRISMFAEPMREAFRDQGMAG